MSAGVYAFTDSLADDSNSSASDTATSIAETIEAMDLQMETLRPEWVAVEADAYYELNQQIRSGLGSMSSILRDMKRALETFQTGNTEVRTAIVEVLESTT
ncbi:MAG: hypothetical protein Q4G50_07370 [Corynebacterium sp.]|uniref:hypothetical protein n=1 Tax=Corynebacterium sp. TaxID=1720 RepID=UPI0026E108B5|nr:hypothetical protein [Corynebacterium sp.]MDO5669807.1 hypothetical protein [Corynebacterium sp.]